MQDANGKLNPGLKETSKVLHLKASFVWC